MVTPFKPAPKVTIVSAISNPNPNPNSPPQTSVNTTDEKRHRVTPHKPPLASHPHPRSHPRPHSSAPRAFSRVKPSAPATLSRNAMSSSKAAASGEGNTVVSMVAATASSLFQSSVKSHPHPYPHFGKKAGRIVSFLPDRYVMVILCALCTCINYADRVNMSVTIISMTTTYDFSLQQQSLVLSSFFLGYIPMQIGGAVLCRRYGAKAVLAYGAFLWSVFTVLTPIAADYGLTVLLLTRVLMGLAEGVAFPSVYHFLSTWIPTHERGRAVALFLTGAHIGTVVALIVSPYIIRILDWRYVFYIFGSVGMIWIAAWQALAYDKDKHLQEKDRAKDKGDDDVYAQDHDDPEEGVSTAKKPASIQQTPAKHTRISNPAAAVPSPNTATTTAVPSTVPASAAPPTENGSDAANGHAETIPLTSDARDHDQAGGLLSASSKDAAVSDTPLSTSVSIPASSASASSSASAPGGTAGGWQSVLTRDEWRIMRRIVSDRRTLGVCLSQAVFSMVHYVILSWLPTYFKAVFMMDAGSLSFTFIPYAAMAMAANLGGYLSDTLIRSGANIAVVRKSVTVVASIGSALSLLVFSRMYSIPGSIAAASVSMAFMSAHSGGFESAYLDLAAPKATGIFKAVSNTMASAAGFLAVPLSTTVLDLLGGSWRLMFASLSVLHILMMIIFCSSFSAERVLTDGAV